jgi:hypothetical protein
VNSLFYITWRGNFGRTHEVYVTADTILDAILKFRMWHRTDNIVTVTKADAGIIV